MHESMMTQIGMDHERQTGQDNGYNDGWVEMNNGYNSSQHQSPIHEYGSYGFMQPMQHHGLPIEPAFTMAPPPTTHTTHPQLVPLIMPGHPTWPSMLTNPASYSAPPVAIPQVANPKPPKLATTHASPSPRKTLTDSDRRRMCQYHEDNPSVKQTEIGAMFGVERSTVSKVLRQKEKYLFPEDRSLSPVKRAKGKFPDIERALSNWVRNSQKQGIPLTDSAIKEKARFFATSVGNNESHLKTNSTSWLEKFKQKNGIGAGKLMRRASETNISDAGSLNPESAGASASQTPNGISPTSPSGLPSPSPLSGSKSDEDLRSDGVNNYLEFGQGNGGYRHSNSQSTTSLSSAFTDTAPSSFSGGPTSPTTPFAFSPDGFMPSQHARLPPPGSNFQRPRSQTFPMLGIDPSFIQQHQSNEPLTPKYNGMSGTAPSSALDSPVQEMGPPFGMDSTISSPPLHHSSSNGSMAPPSSGTPITGLHSPPGSSAPNSPTQDDARRALDTLLTFFSQQPTGLVDQNEYMTVLKLTERLRLQSNNNNNNQLPGGLHRIAEQDNEQQIHNAPKMESSMSAGC
ncbi:centromere binding protein B [Phlyctema vagabunda]|uniref:Centromere binding protein B n=1 Tax=Phlyctema vagabunda TaxID=108571 RepID=A0ABR4PRJ5_9HELO